MKKRNMSSGANQEATPTNLLTKDLGMDEDLARKVLLYACFYRPEPANDFPEPFKDKDGNEYGGPAGGNYFTQGASQIDLNISSLARMESLGEVESETSEDYADLPCSGAYQRLVHFFVDRALKQGGSDAFQEVIWRAYMAGRLCPIPLELSKV